WPPAASPRSKRRWPPTWRCHHRSPGPSSTTSMKPCRRRCAGSGIRRWRGDRAVAEITLVEAVNLALARALEDDPGVVLFGEDVGVNGGVFRASDGLQRRFGKERV